MNATERSIFEQFPFWTRASLPAALTDAGKTYVIIGCGTSYNLALSIAAAFNIEGLRAVAVPAGEWLHRPDAYVPTAAVDVIALSRSGESTETVLAAKASRERGQHVIGITCADGSALTLNSDRVIYAETHPEEDIVMTSSASLMLLIGYALAGQAVSGVTEAAEALLTALNGADLGFLGQRSHVVFLGGGAAYGVAVEGSLKLQEMSLTYTQAFHPMEYRHGPVSLVDERTLVVLLYSEATGAEEAKLCAELTAKGAIVIGLGGPGTLSLPMVSDETWRPLEALPALQLLGERMAQAKGLDTMTPRHLTKVVKLG